MSVSSILEKFISLLIKLQPWVAEKEEQFNRWAEARKAAAQQRAQTRLETQKKAIEEERRREAAEKALREKMIEAGRQQARQQTAAIIQQAEVSRSVSFKQMSDAAKNEANAQAVKIREAANNADAKAQAQTRAPEQPAKPTHLVSDVQQQTQRELSPAADKLLGQARQGMSSFEAGMAVAQDATSRRIITTKAIATLIRNGWDVDSLPEPLRSFMPERMGAGTPQEEIAAAVDAYWTASNGQWVKFPD